MTDVSVRIVLVTAPSSDEATRLARTLVEERLAACVNVLPGLTSVYRWEGSIEEADESLMIVKTSEERVQTLERRIVELHPYDVPEVVTLDVASGHAPYLAWVAEESEG